LLLDKLYSIEALLQKILENQQSNKGGHLEEDAILTIQEDAEYTSLTKPSIYGLCYRRSLPHSKQGKRL
jgi:predicted DNA-binding transcriptional regulator AlpA